MVDYISAEDIIEAYGLPLLQRIAKSATPPGYDQVLVQRGIDSASAIIDAYLSVRYTVPLVAVPQAVRECAIDIAVYKISLERAGRIDEMRVRYEDALKMLLGMGAGTVGLGLSASDLSDNGDTEDPKSKLSRSVRTYLC